MVSNSAIIVYEKKEGNDVEFLFLTSRKNWDIFFMLGSEQGMTIGKDQIFL